MVNMNPVKKSFTYGEYESYEHLLNPVKKSFTYGEYESYEHLLFMFNTMNLIIYHILTLLLSSQQLMGWNYIP